MSLNIKGIILAKVIYVILGIFAVIIGLNKDAYAGNGFYPLGFGAKVIGRGGTDIAVADDTLSINLNPAGMTRIKGEKLDISGSAGVGFTHFQNDFNDKDGNPFYFLLPGIGYVNNREDRSWAYGIAFYTPGGLGTSYSLRHPLYESELDCEDLIVSLRLSPAIAYRVTPRLSVGFAPYFSYTRLDVKGPFFKSNEEAANISKGVIPGSGLTYGMLLKEIADEYTVLSELKAMDAFGYGFSFGVLYEVKPQLTIGLSYVSRQRFDLKGRFYMDANRQMEAIGKQYPEFSEQFLSSLPRHGNDFTGHWDAEASFTFPQKVGMGVAYRPSDRWLIAFDATWIEWSDFLGDWVVNLSNGDNEDINAIIGSSGFSDRTPQDWKNGVIFSLGIEHALTKKAILRAGFAHGNSIVPSDTIHLLGPAISEDHLTLGWGYHWKSFEFNLAYEHIFRNSSSPVTQHRLGIWFDNSKVSASADIIHTMYTWYF